MKLGEREREVWNREISGKREINGEREIMGGKGNTRARGKKSGEEGKAKNRTKKTLFFTSCLDLLPYFLGTQKFYEMKGQSTLTPSKACLRDSEVYHE